ncbi:MAG: redoxin domain-containing protein [Acidobacteria bacterium]|nr:redoxin domain-containing protein [Acidobacteriota bacterium]
MKRKSILLAALLAAFVFVLGGDVDAQQTFAVGAKLDNFKLKDTDGRERSLDELKGEKGTVLVFLSAQCPVVRGYNERIKQIAADYAGKGINFVGINSNATESLDWVKSNAAEIGYKFPVLIDTGNALADRLGASVTPEVYFLDAQNVLLYHGAIDNDKTGRAITTNYLKTAFDASLDGRKIEKTSALAFGCSIKRKGD